MGKKGRKKRKERKKLERMAKNMLPYQPTTFVVYSIDEKWYFGYILGRSFLYGNVSDTDLKRIKDVKCVQDVVEIDSYMSIKDYIKVETGLTSDRAITLMKKLGVDKMFIKVNRLSSSSGNLQNLCKSCCRSCKNTNVFACSSYLRYKS